MRWLPLCGALLLACADNQPGSPATDPGSGLADAGMTPLGQGGQSAVAPEVYADCDVAPGGPRVLRRLSHAEYDNTVAELLGLQGRAAKSFAADTVVEGYDNNARALSVTPLLGDQLYAEAARLAGEAVKELGTRVPCDPAGGDAACAERFIADFGLRAFRRPLDQSEVERYRTVYDVGSQDGGFSAGVELVLTAFLQSPNLLYRSELGVPDVEGEAVVTHSLDPYELASELAYDLTGAPPDAALLQAAAAGELSSIEQLRAAAERLIDSERGRAHLVRFVTQWLDVQRLSSVPKDAALFPEFDQGVREAMAGELARFVEHVVYEGEGTLQALLTAPLQVVDDRLAAFYRLPAVEGPADDQGFAVVQASEPQRRGVLTLGAVMTTHARPDSSSPVHRGKLVRQRLLCQPLPPPPPGIVVQPPAVDPELSVRERYAAHSAEQPCQGCHQLIDPIGFGFEHFDGVGRFRGMDAGRAVDATGRITGSDSTDGAFDGAAELAAQLAGSPEVAQCFALQWMRFAYGLSEGPELSCALQQLQASLQPQTRIRDLLLATVETAHFRTRLGARGSGVVEPTEPHAQVPPTSAAAQPVQQPDLEVTTRTDSSWASGRCQTVTVHNSGDQTLVWSVTLSVTGTLTDSWNCVPDGDSGEVTFGGADWNRSVAPGQDAQFGYCTAL